MSKSKVKVLWIGPYGAPGASGEVVYDRNISKMLQTQSDVTFYLPKQVNRLMEVFGVLRGRAWLRSRYWSPQTIADVREISRGMDVVVCSWETFDFLATYVERPVILLLHNVTSDALPEMYPGNVLVKWLATFATSHEQSLYPQENVKSIFVLSQRDKVLIEKYEPKADVFWIPPGAPPSIELSDQAVFDPKLNFSGSHIWRPKRRDLQLFLHDVRQLGLSISSDETLPDEMVEGIVVTPGPIENPSYYLNNISIGVIPDRFLAGHKLKAMYYIANNSLVFSYSDISPEFCELPYADKFIKIVKGPNEILAAISELKEMDAAEFRLQFMQFKTACLERFSWEKAGSVLSQQVLAAATLENEESNT